MGAPIVADWGAYFLKTITREHQNRLKKIVTENESAVELLLRQRLG